MRISFSITQQDYINFLIYYASLSYSRTLLSIVVVFITLVIYMGSSLYWVHKGAYFTFLGVMFVVLIILFTWRRIIIHFKYHKLSKNELLKIIEYHLDFDEQQLQIIEDNHLIQIHWPQITHSQLELIGPYYYLKINYIEQKKAKHILIPIPKYVLQDKYKKNAFFKYFSLT